MRRACWSIPLLLAALISLSSSRLAAAPPEPAELLRSSIGHHDPHGEWSTGTYRMVLRETRPDATSRDTTIVIDNSKGTFETSSMRDEDMVVGRFGPDGCQWLLNGSPNFSEESRDQHNLTCDRLARVRNYYVYLWGLPMKLRDPGTLLGDTVVETEFEGQEALALRVTYEPAVGGDIWYFYFHPVDHRLIGYRFYHDEAANDGEYITLKDEVDAGGLRLPKTRGWYTHKEDKYLGTDSLMSIERP